MNRKQRLDKLFIWLVRCSMPAMLAISSFFVSERNEDFNDNELEIVEQLVGHLWEKI